MFYGLIAAIGWGISAVAATNAARRAGTYVAVLSGQGIGVVVLLLLTAFLRPSLGAIDGHTVLGLASAGLLGLLGYLAFYRALEYGGAVGLVSAISATYGGVTTLLAVLVLGEHLSAYGTAGVVLAVTGVAMATARARGTAETPPIAVGEPMVGVAPGPSRVGGLSRAGIPLAFASALTYGVGGFLLGDYSARAGWLGSALVAHGSSVTALLLALPFLGRPKAWRGSASGVSWAAAGPQRCRGPAGVRPRRPGWPGGRDRSRFERLSGHSAGRRAVHVRRTPEPPAAVRGEPHRRGAGDDRTGLIAERLAGGSR